MSVKSDAMLGSAKSTLADFACKAKKATKKGKSSGVGVEKFVVLVFRAVGIIVFFLALFGLGVFEQIGGWKNRGFTLASLLVGIFYLAVCFAVSELISLLSRIAESNEKIAKLMEKE